MQGLVVMGLLAEGDRFQAVRAGMVRGVARKQGWGRWVEQTRKGRGLFAGSGGITEEGDGAHATSMTTAQLQSQVSRKGSPIVYHYSVLSPWDAGRNPPAKSVRPTGVRTRWPDTFGAGASPPPPARC